MHPQRSNVPSSPTTQCAAEMHLQTNSCIDHSGRECICFENLWGHRTHVKATHEISIVMKRQHWCITRTGHPQTQRRVRPVSQHDDTQVATEAPVRFFPLMRCLRQTETSRQRRTATSTSQADNQQTAEGPPATVGKNTHDAVSPSHS